MAYFILEIHGDDDAVCRYTHDAGACSGRKPGMYRRSASLESMISSSQDYAELVARILLFKNRRSADFDAAELAELAQDHSHLLLKIDSAGEGVADRSKLFDIDDDRTIDWVQVIPWEALTYQVYRSANVDIPFSAWLHRHGPYVARLSQATTHATSQQNDKPKCVLIVYAQPNDKARLYPAEQVTDIQHAINSLNTQYGSPLRIDILEQGAGDLYEAFCQKVETSDLPLYMIHLIAHGAVGTDGSGQLYFPDQSGQSVQKDMDRLCEAIEKHYAKHGCYPEIVLINSCFSGTGDGTLADSSIAEKLIEARIPYVVANQSAIQVQEMLTFTEAFYQEIQTSRSIYEVVQAGRVALARDVESANRSPADSVPRSEVAERRQLLGLKQDYGLPGWAVPVLYVQSAAMDGVLHPPAGAQHILCLRDGKVMTRVRLGDTIVYIDECPVTQGQWDSVNGGQAFAPVQDLDQARKEDDGSPKTWVNVNKIISFLQKTDKRLLTLEEWKNLLSLDETYDCVPDSNTYGCWQKPNFTKQAGIVSKVRLRSSTHTIGLWGLCHNISEIVADEQRYYLVSSNNDEGALKAFPARDTPLNATLQKEGGRTIGFRTAADVSTVIAWLHDGTALSLD